MHNNAPLASCQNKATPTFLTGTNKNSTQKSFLGTLKLEKSARIDYSNLSGLLHPRAKGKILPNSSSGLSKARGLKGSVAGGFRPKNRSSFKIPFFGTLCFQEVYKIDYSNSFQDSRLLTLPLYSRKKEGPLKGRYATSFIRIARSKSIHKASRFHRDDSISTIHCGFIEIGFACCVQMAQQSDSHELGNDSSWPRRLFLEAKLRFALRGNSNPGPVC